MIVFHFGNVFPFLIAKSEISFSIFLTNGLTNNYLIYDPITLANRIFLAYMVRPFWGISGSLSSKMAFVLSQLALVFEI